MCTFATLQNMEHSVRIAFGESYTTYGGDKWSLPLNPLSKGLGQLNGVSPEIWSIFSTPLLNCLRDSGHGSVLKRCISHDSLILVGYLFVENSTIIQISPSPTTPTTETVRLDQTGLGLFSGVSQTTGRKLIVSKKKWYLLKFKWYSTVQWRLSDNQACLLLKIPEVPHKIERLPASQAYIILGVWIDTNG